MSRPVRAATATWGTVELTHATKHFDQKRPVSLIRREVRRVMALDDVSFQIRPGEFVAYAGPNGAGKSTTFKLLCGMIAPNAGTVRVMGKDPLKDRVSLMREVGVLFGNRSELWWDHPVKTSFEWKKAVWGIDDASYIRMFGVVRELLGLDEFLTTFTRELSLGQRMRANLGLTMLHDPKLILLDEPTLGLDVLAKRQMIDFLKRVNRDQGATILVTSHDMDDLTEMASRLLLINHGKIAFDGNHIELQRRAGDKRSLLVSLDSNHGDAPNIPGAALVEKRNGGYLYSYDAETTPVAELMRSLSNLPGVRDVETGRMPIESVIAELYRLWIDESSPKASE